MFQNPQVQRFYFPSAFIDWMWQCGAFWSDGEFAEIKLRYIRGPHLPEKTVIL